MQYTLLYTLFLLTFFSACAPKDLTGKTPAVERFKHRNQNLPEKQSMVRYSIFTDHPDRLTAKTRVSSYLQDPDTAPKMAPKQERSIGVMLGLAAADSLGSFFEFLPFEEKGYNIPSKKIIMTKDGWQNFTRKENKFHLKPGQWTDDTSMALCLADILLWGQGKLDETQLMWAFYDWWNHGYDNAFNVDPRGSVGRGGNIGLSFDMFKKLNLARDATGNLPTKAGDKYTSGNGSVMRNGAAAIVANNVEKARSLAKSQSKVTHQGDEAAAAAELLSFITYNAINDPSLDPADVKANVFASLNSFLSDEPSVNALAKHKSNVPNAQDALKIENWDWTAPNFSFNAERFTENPGYIGSYSLDALAMALHCVYATNSFEDAVLKAATRGGDADSVGAVVGQIAGAIYGAKNIPKEWRDAVMQWDRDGEIGARGYLLSQIP